MGERTLFRGVSSLPGGSKWTFVGGEIRSKTRYFEPSAWEAQEPLTERQFDTEFGRRFRRILPRYTENHTSVGISLTGGLDTRMVMACLPETNTEHPCYTFVGENGLTLDARLAAQIAIARGLEHRLFRITPVFFRDFGTYLDRTIAVTDGCAGATSSHEIFFNAQAREISPIRLTGNFGSEIFRSVSTFKSLSLNQQLLNGGYADAVAAQSQIAIEARIHPVTFSAFREIPWSLFGLLAAGRSQVTFRTPYLDNDLVALAYRAPAEMRLSPLPALHLIERANPHLASIPTDRGEVLNSPWLRGIIRRGLGELAFKLDYFYSEGLPRPLAVFNPLLNSFSLFGICGLHKFLPYRRWFRKEVSETVIERVASKRVRQAPWWEKNMPETLARAHISGRGNYVRELGAVLNLEAIDRLLVHTESAGGATR